MLEAAIGAFGAGAAEVVVVAEFVGGGAAFYSVENWGGDGDGRVETARDRGPRGFGGGGNFFVL